MKIAMIASEVTPFAKTGGLADVLGTLSLALERLGHEICVIAPAYRQTLRGEFPLRERPELLAVDFSGRRIEATVVESSLGKHVAVYLIRHDEYFDREFLYGEPTGDYPDNSERFSFFSRAALEFLRREPADVVHCHDWQTALAVVFLKTNPARYSEVAHAKTIFTIHNLGFQGIFGQPDWRWLDLDAAYFTPPFLEFYGNINFLKGALVFADRITTVSPSYAEEIMTAEQGFGLEGVLRERAADVVGILNGVDYHLWNPWTDPYLSDHYGEHSLKVKSLCKKSLRRSLGLPDENAAPLFAMISRLTPQKGMDLIEEIFPALMERGAQFVALGNGAPNYEQFLRAAAARYPDQVAVRIGFDDPLAHRIEAGADIFLMPSLYEPCGLNQMYSLKYGTIPIVRAVGGLKDTVQHYDPLAHSGTGFVFAPYTGQALLSAVDQSIAAFKNKIAWTALRRRAMGMDFSWDSSAKRYLDLYRQLIN